MTAKQQAKQLIDNFGNLIDMNDDLYSEEEMYRKHNKDAKKCALLAVNYIISANPQSNPLNTEVFSSMYFWQEVKQEIENL